MTQCREQMYDQCPCFWTLCRKQGLCRMSATVVMVLGEGIKIRGWDAMFGEYVYFVQLENIKAQ